MKVELQLSGLDDILRKLQALPPEIVSKRGGPVKSALRKGAQVLVKAEKANLSVVTSNATESGKRESTGLLQKSIVARRSKPPANEKGEAYVVRPSRKTYTDRSGKKVTTAQTARFLEFGTEKQPAEPWARPALQQQGENVIRTVEDELASRVEQAIKGL